MRSPFARAVLALALVLPTIADAGARTIAFAAAPAQVRKDLLSIFADCGAKPAAVRSKARIEIAPIGGRGHKDYIFAFSQDSWPRSKTTDDFPGGGMCDANYSWTVLWMDVGGGHYQQRIIKNSDVVSKGDQYMILEAGCDAASTDGPWWSFGWVLAWNAKHRTFDPLTQCGKIEAATDWLKAHGYN